jgi:predicted DNA-binding transcriptional regulator YafY
MLHQTKETFEVPKDFDLEEFLGSSFGVYQGEPTTVRIRFSQEVAGYIREKIWHDNQKLDPQEDGSLLFEAVVTGTEESKYWILGWRSHAQVLEPESLKEEICVQAKATLNLYRNSFKNDQITESVQYMK